MHLDHAACYRVIETKDARYDGRIFTGVSTTGIYCRPVCPARTPKAQNVTFYPSAAAAQEAGFRPCLRCRPETAPDLGAWKGTSNTVSRALAMIELGALDESDVETLAGRLGVGGRHLRRLFLQHLGASPVAVAQTRRVLLARQLIAETRLPMAEVALASGFGSIRRFNETFQRLYQKPPSDLRRTKASDIDAAGAGEVVVKLRYRAPYDWAGMLAFFATRAIAGVEAVEGSVYARTIALEGETGWLSVEQGAGDYLVARIRFSKLTALPNIIARLRRVFDLAADPDAIAEDLSTDALLAPLVARRPGLRLPGAWDQFELAIRAVLGQQVTLAAARNMASDMATYHGVSIDTGHPALTRVFPEPRAIADGDLSYLKMPGKRRDTLITVGRAMADQPDFLSARQSLEQAVEALCALPGIGPWTAQYIAMRALREPDAFLAADVGLMRAIDVLTGTRPDAKTLLARAESWRPWRAYAAQHLWAEIA